MRHAVCQRQLGFLFGTVTHTLLATLKTLGSQPTLRTIILYLSRRLRWTPSVSDAPVPGLLLNVREREVFIRETSRGHVGRAECMPVC